jgi:inosose dehydratase
MTKKIKFGYTGITWPGFLLENAVKTVAQEGFCGIELFGWDIENWERHKGGIGKLLEKYDLPLISAYCVGPTHRKEKVDAAIAKVVEWGKLVAKYGGKVITLGGDGLSHNERLAFNLSDHLDTIVRCTNEMGRRLKDIGIQACFHQHTGTAVETQEEVYQFMKAVNTDYVAFGPDIGQLAKGGGDPVKVVKDFAPIIKHLHLKDYKGGKLQFNEKGEEIDTSGFLCYTPLGDGVIDIPKVLEILEKSNFTGYAMVELDGHHFNSNYEGYVMTPEQACARSKKYLKGLGYEIG